MLCSYPCATFSPIFRRHLPLLAQMGLVSISLKASEFMALETLQSKGQE